MQTPTVHAPLDTASHSPLVGERKAADVVARVIDNQWINRTYKRLSLVAPLPAPLAGAGQFFHLECPVHNTDKPFFRRPMSVYRTEVGPGPAGGTVEFLYKVTGAGTRGLAALKVGETLRMLGPLGVGFELRPDWRAVVVLGRGVGLATLAPLSDLAAAHGVDVTAIISCRKPEQMLSIERFERIGADVRIVLDSDGSSDPANVEQILRRLATDQRADAFFTCGSNRLMQLMQRLARELDIPGQVALEQQMACGLGMCFCCVRDFDTAAGRVSRRVCWDGPVFNLEEPLSW